MLKVACMLSCEPDTNKDRRVCKQQYYSITLDTGKSLFDLHLEWSLLSQVQNEVRQG